MSRATRNAASKVETAMPAGSVDTAETAGAPSDETATRAEHAVVRLNAEAFDSAVEMQMSFFEAASRYAQELSDFAARRAKANIADLSSLAVPRSPPELLQMQLGHVRAMFEDYSAEAGRLMTLTRDVIKESGEAVRSSHPDEPDLRKAG